MGRFLSIGRRVAIYAILGAVWLTVSTGPARAQDDVPGYTLYDIPPRWLVDIPTAATLPRASYSITTRFFANGGALGLIDIGLSDRFMLGISYGGEGVLSGGDVDWYPRIGFHIRFRVVDELEYFPAVTVGFSDQGYGSWYAGLDRFTYKARGFFAVVTRNFYFYEWTSGWHAGLNYTVREDKDGDQHLNFFGGVDVTFNYNLALLLEYDAALNDDRGAAAPVTGKGRGYLNLSVKWLFAENLELEVIAKDLLVNRRESSNFSRELRITYVAGF